MRNHKLSIQELTTIGMFTAILCVLSILQIPMPSGVPLTLQTFAVALIGYMLGNKKGVLCILLYLCIGFLGLPVFTGMTGGLGKLFSFTGGFLYGFLFLALLCGTSVRYRNKYFSLFLGYLGLLLCHMFGSLHYAFLTQSSMIQAFLLVSIPYLPKDILLITAACLLSSLLHKTLRKADIKLL